jgi:hypothetical protein
MIRELPDPERWSDLPSRGSTAEQAVGLALRRVRETTEPSDAALARLAKRSAEPEASVALPLAWRAVLVAAIIMATGGAVGAALYKWRRASGAGDRPSGATSVAVPPAVEDHHRNRRQRAPEPPPPVVAPVPAETPPLSPPHATVAVRSPRRPAPALALPTEAGVLASAFHELRSNGDAVAALRSLDEYDRQFPAGAFRGEARIARAEALLALDRRREALPLLEGLEDAGVVPTREIRVTRGELLAEAGRCGDAVRDFDALLVATDGDAAGGRALYGRASCRLRAGEVDRARQDLRRYLQLHADGPFAADARRAMDAPP